MERWILGVMAAVIVLAVIVPFCPDVLISLGGTTSEPDISAFSWVVNFGIFAAILCIVLFLLYTVIRRSRKG